MLTMSIVVMVVALNVMNLPPVGKVLNLLHFMRGQRSVTGGTNNSVIQICRDQTGSCDWLLSNGKIRSSEKGGACHRVEEPPMLGHLEALQIFEVQHVEQRPKSRLPDGLFRETGPAARK